MKKILKTHDQKMYESKSSQINSTDGVEIFHNNFVQLVSNPFSTNSGISDNEAGIGTRIGDKITPKGYSYKMMIELNERFSDVTFRFLFI